MRNKREKKTVKIIERACEVLFYAVIVFVRVVVAKASCTVLNVHICGTVVMLTGHFRITFGLVFIASPGAYIFMGKLVCICLWMKTNFRTKDWAAGLALKKRPKVIRKLPTVIVWVSVFLFFIAKRCWESAWKLGELIYSRKTNQWKPRSCWPELWKSPKKC